MSYSRSDVRGSRLNTAHRDRFPVVSLDFSVTYFLPTAPWAWGRISRYWKWAPGTFLGVKAVGSWGRRPHHLHVPNVMKIWEPKPPGTLWATPELLRDSLLTILEMCLNRSRQILIAFLHLFLMIRIVFGDNCSIMVGSHFQYVCSVTFVMTQFRFQWSNTIFHVQLFGIQYISHMEHLNTFVRCRRVLDKRRSFKK
jgi:hypothetical protein